MGERKERIQNWIDENEIVAREAEVLQVLKTNHEGKRIDGNSSRKRKRKETFNDDFIREESCDSRKDDITHLNAGRDGQNCQQCDVPPDENYCNFEEGGALESELGQNINEGDEKSFSCTSPHEGRKVVDVDLQMPVDQLFVMVFTESNFYLDFHHARNTTDIVQTPWQLDRESGQKKKKVELTVSLNQAIGPKSSRVTENYVMLPCSRPGHLYSLELSAYNSGFRYADAFHCFTHFCLYDTTQHNSSKEENVNITNSDSHSHHQQLPKSSPSSTCHFSVYSQLIYTKSVWTPVKAIIDKSSWLGIEEFYDSLISKLKLECDNVAIDNDDTRKSNEFMRRRKHGVAGPEIADAVKGKVDKGLVSRRPTKGRRKSSKKDRSNGSWILAFITMASLTFLNIFLYYELKNIEKLTRRSNELPTKIDLTALRNDPSSHEEWLKFSLNLIEFDDDETDSWMSDVQKAVNLLLEVEDFLKNLTIKIPLEIRHKVLIESFHKTHHSHTTNEASTKS